MTLVATMSRPEQLLYQNLSDRKWDDVIHQITDNPNVIRRIGYTSMGCSGGWGMPMYAHIAKFLEKSSEYRKSPEMRKIAQAVFDAANTVFSNFTETDARRLRAQYALRGGWMEELAELYADGLTIEDMNYMVSRMDHVPTKVREFIANPVLPEKREADDTMRIENNEDRECCVCLDASPNSIFHPCTHNDFCFDCSRDLKICPICRTEGYAKLIQ